MVLYGIFNQTVLPGKIVVTLTQEEVPGGFSSLPKSLQYFADKGVEYLFVDKNLRPHNKYFYTRQRYPERNIITVDDDLLYYPDTIERLMKLHYQFPKAICANKASKHSEQNRDYTVYNHWTCTWNEGPSIALMALGYGGVLYPPTFTHPHLYNCEEIKALALGADDLWLMVMEILSDTRVVVGDYYAHPLMLPTSQSVALQKTNTGVLCRNNTYLKLLEEKFLFSEHI
jgi:hypothetical protein